MEMVMYIDWIYTVNTLKQISLKVLHVHINAWNNSESLGKV